MLKLLEMLLDKYHYHHGDTHALTACCAKVSTWWCEQLPMISQTFLTRPCVGILGVIYFVRRCSQDASDTGCQ